MIRAVVFDFDGTLTELTLDFSLLREEVLKIARGYTDSNTLKRLDGLYIIEMIYECERHLGEMGMAFFREAFKRLEELEVEAASGKDVFPYTRQTLRDLNNRGIKNCIITRSCLAVLKQVFPDINDYVQGISTRDDVRLVKPDPSHVQHVLKSVQVSPKDAILVGDHPTDITAGKEAGLKTVGVLSGRTKRQSFEEAGADYIFKDIRDIMVLVDGRLSL